MTYRSPLMQRSARTHRLALVFAAMLLALSALAPTTILCVGSGGHLAIEAALAGCCDPETAHGHTGQSVAGRERCADHCTDTAVGMSAACRSPEDATPALHALALCAPGVVAVRPPATVLAGPSLGRPPASLPPRALRTTVNLC